MRVLCCYVKPVQADTAAALALYAPQAEYVRLSVEDQYGYGWAIAERWLGVDDLLIVEPDNVITGEVVPSLTSCGKPWCSFGYEIFPPPYTRICTTGLGCTRFSAQLQREFDFPQIIMRDLCADCGGQHGQWGTLDCRIQTELLRRNTQVHVHGTVGHLHPYDYVDPEKEPLAPYVHMDKAEFRKVKAAPHKPGG